MKGVDFHVQDPTEDWNNPKSCSSDFCFSFLGFNQSDARKQGALHKPIRFLSVRSLQTSRPDIPANAFFTRAGDNLLLKCLHLILELATELVQS